MLSTPRRTVAGAFDAVGHHPDEDDVLHQLWQQITKHLHTIGEVSWDKKMTIMHYAPVAMLKNDADAYDLFSVKDKQVAYIQRTWRQPTPGHFDAKYRFHLYYHRQMTKLAGLLWKRHKYASKFKVVQPHNPYNHNIPNWVPDGTIGVALPRGKLYDAVADKQQTNRARWGPSKDMETNVSRLWQEFGSRVSEFFAEATDRGVQHVAMPPGVKFAFDSAGLNVFNASGLHVTGTILGLIDYTAKSAATQGTEIDDWSKPLIDLASASRDLYEALHDDRYPRNNTVVKFAPTSAHIDLTMARWAKFIAAARDVLGDELQSNAEQIVANHGAGMFGGTQLLLHGRTAGEYKWFNQGHFFF